MIKGGSRCAPLFYFVARCLDIQSSPFHLPLLAKEPTWTSDKTGSYFAHGPKTTWPAQSRARDRKTAQSGLRLFRSAYRRGAIPDRPDNDNLYTHP
jgi:hypothetical protein